MRGHARNSAGTRVADADVTGGALAHELGKRLMDARETRAALNEMWDHSLDDGLLYQRVRNSGSGKLEWLAVVGS